MWDNISVEGCVQVCSVLIEINDLAGSLPNYERFQALWRTKDGPGFLDFAQEIWDDESFWNSLPEVLPSDTALEAAIQNIANLSETRVDPSLLEPLLRQASTKQKARDSLRQNLYRALEQNKTKNPA